MLELAKELHSRKHHVTVITTWPEYNIDQISKARSFSEKEIERIIDLLSNVKYEIKISKEEHIQSLHNRHTSETVCPSCGSDLLKRTVKQGARQGSQFLGCSSFPRCRYTKELQKESKSNWRIITIGLILLLVIFIVNRL